MTTTDTHAGPPAGVAAVSGWLTSSDHTRIGRLLLGGALVGGIGTAVSGFLLAAERVTNGYSVFDGDATPQLVALFRYLLVLGTLAPLVLGLAVAVVPAQVGSRAVAFPRLAQTGLWAWELASVLVIISLLGNGGPGGGTTDLVDLHLLSVGLAAAGLCAVAVSVAATVLTSRAAGMGIDDVPVMSWGALVGAVAMILALPVVVGSVIYLYIDHTYGQVAFGGNLKIADHLGFATTQPFTFIALAVVAGIVGEVSTAGAEVAHPLRSAMFAGVALVASGVLGAVTQSQHVLVTDGSSGTLASAVPFLLLNGLPVLGLLVVLATATKVVASARPRIDAAFAFAFLGAGMVLVGLVANLVQNIGAADLTGTSFEEGATTFIVYGSAMVVAGGLLHLSPSLWGRKPDGALSLPLAGLALLGTALASFPNLVAGLADQPAGVVEGLDYDGPVGLWNGLAAAGHVLVLVWLVALAATLVVTVGSKREVQA